MRVILALAVILVAGLVIGLSCDKATEPLEPEPKDYAVYMANLGHNSIYEYHPLTGVIDSMALPFGVSGAWVALTVSADGKTLYVTANDSVYAVDTDTKEITPFWPEAATIAVSEDGHQLAVLGNDFAIVDVSTQTVIFTDTSRVYDGAFVPDGSEFYGLTEPLPNYRGLVYRLKLDSTHEVTRTQVPVEKPFQVLFSDDASRWYLYCAPEECEWLFAVYDVPSDSIIFEHYLVPGWGDMDVTPSSRYVVYTSPGPAITWCPQQQGEIFFYDIAGNELASRLQVIGDFGGGGEHGPLPVDDIAHTPDGRWTIITSQSPWITLVDAQNPRIVRIDTALGFPALAAPTCQTIP